MNTAPHLIAYSFEIRTAAHFAHLKTKSYSKHMALEAFYEGILELTDEFAEVYQGLHAVITRYPNVGAPESDDPVKFLADYLEWLTDNCDDASDDDESLENLIAEMRALTARTLYKLKNLG